MIFQTQNQLNCMLIFIFAGTFIAFISTFFLFNFRKKIIKMLIYCVFYSFFCVFFIFLLNFYNFGKFSLTLLFSYLIGFIWMKFITRKLVVIFQNKCYNLFKRFNKKRNLQKENLNVKSKES